MKLLISCVNSKYSLLGYDTDTKEIFWSVPSTQFKACGICLVEETLFVASDDYLIKFSPEGDPLLHRVKHSTDPLLHSIHPINDTLIGAVDTGHSLLRVLNHQFEQVSAISPLATWQAAPPDAIHLNDFVVTPLGILASCFDYRPWRAVKDAQSFEDWCSGGYGLILNLTGFKEKGKGKVMLCNLCQPHSLTLYKKELYLCSSGNGTIHKAAFLADNSLRELARAKITDTHFLRGLYCHEDGFFVGGSTSRHGQKLADSAAIYSLDPELKVKETLSLTFDGEIYDILPWSDSLNTQRKTISNYSLS